MKHVKMIDKMAMKHNTHMIDVNDYQSEGKMEWSKEDTAFVKNIRDKKHEPVKTSYEEIVRIHESLEY